MDGLKRLLRDPEVVDHVNDLDEDGMAAMHYAARANHFEAVALLIKQGNAGTRYAPCMIVCMEGVALESP